MNDFATGAQKTPKPSDLMKNVQNKNKSSIISDKNNKGSIVKNKSGLRFDKSSVKISDKTSNSTVARFGIEVEDIRNSESSDEKN